MMVQHVKNIFPKLQINYVPEVLNVHMNENFKKFYFFERIYCLKQWKINFWDRKWDFLKYFFKS